MRILLLLFAFVGSARAEEPRRWQLALEASLVSLERQGGDRTLPQQDILQLGYANGLGLRFGHL